MSEIKKWWRSIPPGIQMTDERARALLEHKVEPSGDAELTFVDANDLTIIPQTVVRERIISNDQPLSLHKPQETSVHVYGQE